MYLSYPSDLPISARREEIVAALRSHQVIIVAGETGSGKTTQLPKMCVEAGLAERGRIGCTQPRRVAALSISKRVAEEMRVPWGREVGCKMRFQDDTSRETKLKFMTDGILLAEVQGDRDLRAYTALIIDEAHERSLNIDFLLGYLQGLLKRRPDLKLIITSATIDTVAFSEAFGGAPIIEVSGRTYPVDIRYAPVATFSGHEGEADFIDAAVGTVEEILLESHDGDILIFMPTERDIRETRDLLEGRLGHGFEILPLFGRMSSGDQQRIFSTGRKRRVVIATNIAETSLTIPRIRWVIDTGLARVSRYTARTRTKRLPVEPVAQSSGNQRAGRAGRVQDGICVRLYTEEDFLKRPSFTQPEIQRANLAEVILRMMAFRLGEIENFPFLNPPLPGAIKAGYLLLHELGALSDTNEMTDLGHELARLPLDPTLGRMLLQAQTERVLPEMLVLAAGLSVPDPRERPEEQKEAATAAHRRFNQQGSDFLTLLKIWESAPDMERGTGNALRKFCKANFLSMTRMREWRDVLGQLRDALTEDADRSPQPQLPPDQACSDALHRCVLAGLPSQLGKKEERNFYKSAGNRVVTIFPGSGLYERGRKPQKGAPTTDKEEKSRQPEWIVAGEIVQTSQLFARTAGRIEPEWAVQVAGHLCEFRTSEPHWNLKAGRVLATERVLLHGLEVRRGRVDFSRIDPVAATEIFIRCVLIEGETEVRQRFYASNQKLRDKLETAFARVRSRRVFDVARAMFDFYKMRLEGISSMHDLNRLVQERGQDFLCAAEADLSDGHEEIEEDLDQFPDHVSVGNTVLPVSYSYAPGAEGDGVTVQVPLPVAEHLTSGQLQWMVPGLRSEIAGTLLRALPRAMRRLMMPLEAKIVVISHEFDPGRREFLDALAQFLRQRWGLEVKASDWPVDALPPYLRPRIEVVDAKQNTVTSGRDISAIQGVVARQEIRSSAWERAVQQWERANLKSWNIGDLPESIVIEHIGGAPVLAWPGLELREGTVNLRLFRNRADAERGSPVAVQQLAGLVLTQDLAWLQKDLRSLTADAPRQQMSVGFQQALTRLTAASTGLPRPDVLQAAAYQHILDHVLHRTPALPLTVARFEELLHSARSALATTAVKLRGICSEAFALWRTISTMEKKYPGMASDLHRLLPSDFPRGISHTQIVHVPRYLKAIIVRAERACLQPAKDAEKAQRLQKFHGWENFVTSTNHDAFHWLLEEYRVSIFAQELGTAQPVSDVRLSALITTPPGYTR